VDLEAAPQLQLLSLFRPSQWYVTQFPFTKHQLTQIDRDRSRGPNRRLRHRLIRSHLITRRKRSSSLHPRPGYREHRNRCPNASNQRRSIRLLQWNDGGIHQDVLQHLA